MLTNRFRMSGPAVWGLGIFFVLGTLPVAGQAINGHKGLTLADLAPADAFAYVEFAGLAESSAAVEQLGLYKLWREPSVQKFLGGLKAEYMKMAANVPQGSSAEWQGVKELFSGRMAVAAGGLTVVWSGDGPIPMPGVVCALDVGDRRDHVRGMLKKLVSEAQKSDDHFQQEVVKFGDRRVTAYRIGDRRTRVTVYTTFEKNLFLMGIGKMWFERCLANAAAGDGSLAHSPVFRRARSKADGKQIIEAFVNVNAFSSRVRGLVPDPWLAALHGLGLDAVGGVYFASSIHGGATNSVFYFDAPAPRRGLVHALADQKIRPETLAVVPEDAVYMAALRCDLVGAYDAVLKAARSVVPAREMRGFERELKQLDREIGMPLRQLLTMAGDEVVVYAQLAPNKFIPKVVASFTVPDARQALQFVKGAMAHSRVETREIKFGDQVVHVVELDGDVPLSPAFAVRGDRILVSLTTGGLKSALRRLSSPDARNIAHHPGFQRVMGHLGASNGTWIEFLDTKRLASIGLDAAEEFLPGLVNPREFPVDFAQMPDAEVVLKHLDCWGGVVYGDKDGIVCKGHSIGIAGLVAIAARIVDKTPGSPLHAIGRWESGQRKHQHVDLRSHKD